MNNPFQEQLLKAGLVTEQQVKQVQKGKKKGKQQLSKKQRQKQQGEAALHAQREKELKAERDREQNLRKQQQAKAKAISAEINEMIKQHKLVRDEGCDVPYNFEHQGKVKRIYINQDMKQQLVKGKLGIARIDGVYELVPLSIAEKIRERNEKRVVIFEPDSKPVDDNDPYAGYEVPDDLMW